MDINLRDRRASAGRVQRGDSRYAGCKHTATRPADGNHSAYRNRSPANTHSFLYAHGLGRDLAPGGGQRSQRLGLGAAFANQITKDVGEKVVLDDFAIDNLTSVDVLEVMKDGTSSIPGLSNLPEALKNADVILLTPSPVFASNLETLVAIQHCLGAAPGVPNSCTPNSFDSYTADLEAIWTKIFELRTGKPTILRGLDATTPDVRLWQASQTFEACTACWETYSDAARKASETFHIPFFSRYDVFNGKDHHIDPFIMGYVRGDGIHPNDSAQIYAFQLLAELGYTPVTPP